MSVVSQVCPRCGAQQPWLEHTGHLEESVCRACGGRFVPQEQAQQLVQTRLGLQPKALRELAGHFSGPTLLCPGCRSNMAPIRLRGVALDLCTNCGGLWMDQGELSRFAPDVAEVGQPVTTAPRALAVSHQTLGHCRVRNMSERTEATAQETSWMWLVGVGAGAYWFVGFSWVTAVTLVGAWLLGLVTGVSTRRLKMEATPGTFRLEVRRPFQTRVMEWRQGTFRVTLRGEGGVYHGLVLLGDGGNMVVLRSVFREPLEKLGHVLSQRTGFELIVDAAPKSGR